MSPTDAEIARGRALVAAQRKALAPKPERATVRCVAKVTLYYDKDTEKMDRSIEEAKAALLAAVSGHGGFSTETTSATMLNGDVEVRIAYKRHMDAAKAESEMDAQAAVEEAKRG